MNKLDLVQRLARVIGHRGDAQKVVNALISEIRSSLINGEKVVLSGIGSLHPKMRKVQRRHNPNTMEPILTPPKRIVKFIPSKDLFPKA
jgi:DNA-binding protein HU-beta